MKNKKLVLIGGGGHCKSVLDSALSAGEYEEIVITDAMLPAGTRIFGCEVAGTDAILPDLYKEGYEYAFITVGSIKDASLRAALADKAARLGYTFPPIIDPSAAVSKHARVGNGAYIGKRAVINADAVIGEHCIVNTGAIVEHECHIGDFTHVSVGTILCGNVSIGRESFVGAGAAVIQGLSLGNHVIVGANSTVLKNVKDGMTWIGS